MKFILIDAKNNIRPICTNSLHCINEKCYIDEIVLKKDKLDMLVSYSEKIFNNIKLKYYKRKIKNKVRKIICSKAINNEPWFYILSKDISKMKKLDKFASDILDECGGKKFVHVSEMNTNIFRYIAEYEEQQQITSHELKVLLVISNMSNINFKLIESLINKYKKVNIYLAEKPASNILKKLSHINEEEGTCIEVIKYSKKAFLEYNVLYFVDDFRTNYPRMRISKSALVIDVLDEECDKYNSNVVFLNSINKNVETLDKLNKQYGGLYIAAAVRKMVN